MKARFSRNIVIVSLLKTEQADHRGQDTNAVGADVDDHEDHSQRIYSQLLILICPDPCTYRFNVYLVERSQATVNLHHIVFYEFDVCLNLLYRLEEQKQVDE